MTNLSLINQMLSELVICLKGVFCRGRVRTEDEKEAKSLSNGRVLGAPLHISLFYKFAYRINICVFEDYLNLFLCVRNRICNLLVEATQSNCYYMHISVGRNPKSERNQIRNQNFSILNPILFLISLVSDTFFDIIFFQY